eukprot:6620620-Pyramimonas_sp.AAC.1
MGRARCHHLHSITQAALPALPLRVPSSSNRAGRSVIAKMAVLQPVPEVEVTHNEYSRLDGIHLGLKKVGRDQCLDPSLHTAVQTMVVNVPVCERAWPPH